MNLPPDCLCASFFTVRGTHKADCPAKKFFVSQVGDEKPKVSGYKISKRISITQREAGICLEWYLALVQSGVDCPCDCVECKGMAKKLRKFMGRSATTRLVKLLKQYPYFPQNKMSLTIRSHTKD